MNSTNRRGKREEREITFAERNEIYWFSLKYIRSRSAYLQAIFASNKWNSD